MSAANTFTQGRAIRLTVLSLGALIFLSPYIFMLSAAGKM
jgi:multiple sugar transport system permease protein